jgi:hypothetical protein
MMVRSSSSQGVYEREVRNARNFFIRVRPFSEY